MSQPDYGRNEGMIAWFCNNGVAANLLMMFILFPFFLLLSTTT